MGHSALLQHGSLKILLSGIFQSKFRKFYKKVKEKKPHQNWTFIILRPLKPSYLRISKSCWYNPDKGIKCKKLHTNQTRGSVSWVCVTYLSFCFEETLYRTFHGASYQISVHLTTQFQRRILFRYRPIRNIFTPDRGEMKNRHRGPSIDASYQVSVELAKGFQRRRLFRNWPIRNKDFLWQPCLLTDRDEMKNLCRRPSKNASYQVSVHLEKRFIRDFLEINKSETRIACGGHVCKRIRTKWAIFKEDLSRMLPTKFLFIWQSGFRGKYFLEINQT